MTTKRREHKAVLATVLFLFTSYGVAQPQNKAMPKTQIVLLGTGTPLPDPDRSGPSTAVIVNGTPYIVDFGTGVVRQAAAARKKGVHGDVPAYGYRFETPDRTIVISGDASPDGAVLQNCNGCDVLIHEVYTQASFAKVSAEWKKYRLAYHTSSEELADLATKAKPGLLILYHRANPGCDQARTEECREAGSEEQLLREVRRAYSGKVVAGHDLDIY